VHELREKVKLELARRIKACDICGKPEPTDLHEIVYPILTGGKYSPNTTELAKAVYVKENAVMLCHDCNVRIGTGGEWKTRLLRKNMRRYGNDAVVKAMREIAKHLKIPCAYIPVEVDWIQILE